MDVIAEGLGVLEGPVVCQDGSVVVTSIDQGRLFRLEKGSTSVLGETGGGPNGATEGADNCIYVAQNGGAAPARNERSARAGVQVIDPRTGSISYFGEGMVAPNDICFGPDGFLYVTDPSRKPERDDGRIWRCDIRRHTCELILTCDWYPNGIGFSTDDEWLYVADSRHRRIVRTLLAEPGRIEDVVKIDHGIPDGFAFDADGDLLVACPNFDQSGDVQVYRGDKLVEVIRPGQSNLYLNLALAPDARLYICDASRGEVLAMPWRSPALPLHPFRTSSG